jgi:hypothetical protein
MGHRAAAEAQAAMVRMRDDGNVRNHFAPHFIARQGRDPSANEDCGAWMPD